MRLFQEKFKDIFELPDEVIADLPLIMITGHRKLLLENHKGIAAYNRETVKIRIKNGYLIIEGRRLEIEEIQSEHLQLSGTINKICFDRK